MTLTDSSITPVTAAGPDALGELVRQAIASATPIVDYGKAHQDLGNPPPARHFQLTQATASPDGIVEHYAQDLTICVEGGATLGQVREALKPSNQFIPFDADPDLTFTEIVTANLHGPLRLTYGGPRDLLLGLHYVDGLGRDIHVGGRTVKNVAGLDVTRLMVGSLGELGLVHQVTLRTYAIPEQAMVVDVALDKPALLDDCMTAWLITDACPAWVTLLRHGAQWRVRLAYYGKASACAAQLHALEAFIETLPGLRIIGSADRDLDSDLAEHHARSAWRRTSQAVVKLTVPPASTGQAAEALDRFGREQLGQAHSRLTLDALPAHGCLHVGGDLDAAQAHLLDQAIARIITTHGGVRSWVRRPAGTSGRIAPFKPIPPEMAMLIRLKRTMDPHHILNPGRCLVQESSPQ